MYTTILLLCVPSGYISLLLLYIPLGTLHLLMVYIPSRYTVLMTVMYSHSPCSLAAIMTSAEGSKKFHYNIPAPLHSTCWINTFEDSKWSEVGSYSFFIFLMYTFKHGLALSRFFKSWHSQSTFKCVHTASREEAVWAQLESNPGPIQLLHFLDVHIWRLHHKDSTSLADLWLWSR